MWNRKRVMARVNDIDCGRYRCAFSSWDTNHFGVKSGKITIKGAIDQADLINIEYWMEDFDFVTIYNVHNNPMNNLALSRSKLRPFVADVNIAFSADVLRVATPKSDYSILIESDSARDEGTLAIASACFTHSRFFNDPNIPSDKAQLVYAHWVGSAFHRPDRFFAKAKAGGNTCGFVLFTINLSEKTSNIELIGVLPETCGTGIGSALLSEVAIYVGNHGITKMHVGTQATNIGAARFYESNGFTYAGCTSVHHVWPRARKEFVDEQM